MPLRTGFEIGGLHPGGTDQNIDPLGLREAFRPSNSSSMSMFGIWIGFSR